MHHHAMCPSCGSHMSHLAIPSHASECNGNRAFKEAMAALSRAGVFASGPSSAFRLVDRFAALVDEQRMSLRIAVQQGALDEDGISIVLCANMLRAIDRFTELPDDRDLTPGEQHVFAAALVQVAINAMALISDLGLEQQAIQVALAPTARASQPH